jgi:hypothetical protein
MKIFTDVACLTEVSTLDLGIVPAGEVKQFEFYVKNPTKAYLRELQFSTSHNEIAILTAPKDLNPEQSGRLLVEWSPSVTLKEGLKTQLLINGKEIWQ